MLLFKDSDNKGSKFDLLIKLIKKLAPLLEKFFRKLFLGLFNHSFERLSKKSKICSIRKSFKYFDFNLISVIISS